MSLSYYYSLDGSDPVFITKLTAADHSAGGVGYGFFDVSTETGGDSLITRML